MVWHKGGLSSGVPLKIAAGARICIFRSIHWQQALHSVLRAYSKIRCLQYDWHMPVNIWVTHAVAIVVLREIMRRSACKLMWFQCRNPHFVTFHTQLFCKKCCWHEFRCCYFCDCYILGRPIRYDQHVLSLLSCNLHVVRPVYLLVFLYLLALCIKVMFITAWVWSCPCSEECDYDPWRSTGLHVPFLYMIIKAFL